MREKCIGTWCKTAFAAAVLLAAGLLVFGWAHPPEKVNIDTRNRIGISDEYAGTLFDISRVHTINLVIPELNWNYMTSHANEEPYVLCDVVVDGETVTDAAIRPKGNSSLTSVAMQGSERFSFKIEFDHYHPGNTCRGLDKLALNNLGSDLTCMKDYFSYRMMQEAGAAGCLCSYTLLQVNGRDFGLYLAVEGVEDSFAYRNFGESPGQIYKPDVYAMDSLANAFSGQKTESRERDAMPGTISLLGANALGEQIKGSFGDREAQTLISAGGYSGDSPAAYQFLFDTAVFPLNDAQQRRYIAAVRTLNTSEHPEDALDLEQLIPYFVAHNFVNNYDGYTGITVHNFYLRENSGRLSLLPWDYNLAFGAFTMEGALESFLGGSSYALDLSTLGLEGMTASQEFVNYPIDTPMFCAENADRPLFGAWIARPAYRDAYHQAYDGFLTNYLDSGSFEAEYQAVYAMLLPYAERGLIPCASEAFRIAAEELHSYCGLRSQAIRLQLDGSMPSTAEGQRAQPETLLPVGDLNLGKTIDFSGLAFGLTREDVQQVLDAVAGDGDHTLEGVMQAVQALAKDPSGAMPMVQRVWSQSRIVRRAVGGIILPAVLLIIAIAALLIGLRRVKRIHRGV